jgi:hypothetical protein
MKSNLENGLMVKDETEDSDYEEMDDDLRD